VILGITERRDIAVSGVKKMTKPHVGMIGLGVMGANLALNIESKGFPCAVYNRSGDVTDEFMAKWKGKSFVASKTLQEFVSSMESPRQIFIMVKAGSAVDQVIDGLIPLLTKGDIIIDGGNTYFADTQTREKKCHDAGMNFMGVGISGGEEGARHGPSLMPGGPRAAWEIMAPMLKKIAAQEDGPCVNYIGPDGAGHFVKTVHNGIEYADMQLIAEAYHLLRGVLGSTPTELGKVFGEWNKGVLSSFLIEITAKVFEKRDEDGVSFLVDKVLDCARQKGTGKWTAQIALDLGVPVPALVAAVDARNLSALKEERVIASKVISGPDHIPLQMDKGEFVTAVHDALYCAKILSYAQGMALIGAASKEHKWDLHLNEIAAIWRGGCIIRARFLNEIKRAYEENKSLANLILDPFMKKEIERTVPSLRRIVGEAAMRGIPTLAFSTSLAYLDSYRSADLPQNLTQAQRDFFGAHTFERRDRAGTFHADWSR